MNHIASVGGPAHHVQGQEPTLEQRINHREAELTKQLSDLKKVKKTIESNPGLMDVMEAVRHLGY